MAVQLIAAGAGILGGLFSGFGAKKRARRAAAQARRYEAQLAAAERNRQEIINPYEGITDLSSMITNPFADMQVATRAAEMQASETDISLATSLDVLRATGASSGGATALAQAASRSKANISANIEQQEAEISRMRAQGEFQAQQLRMSEAQRLQQADVAGKQFMFGAREEREMQKLDRLQGMSNRYATQAAQYRQAQAQAFGSAFSSLAGLGMSIGEAGGFKKFMGGE